jgi:glycosyltransferase involved in cell wall biosynthesis
MKIALIDPSLFTWPYDFELAEGLRRVGHEVKIFGKHIAEEDVKADHRQLLAQHFYPELKPPRGNEWPRSVFLAVKGVSHVVSMARLLVALRRWRPDVIHFQWAPLPSVDRWFVPLLERIAPVVLTVHDSTPFNGNPRGGLQSIGSVAIMRQFKRVIVHTEAARTRLIDYGVPPDRIERVPHGVLGQPVPVNEAPVSADPARPVTLLLFGRIKPYKGVDLLLEAVSRLKPEHRARCRLWVVGEPHMDVTPLQQQAHALGLQDKVDFDFRFVKDEEIPGIFARSDVMVLPYREIDASGVLMIALASGLPIVASKMGLFAELLENDRHGFLTPPENIGALAAALGELIDSPSKRAAMSQEVRELQKSIPDWVSIARRTEGVYAEVGAPRSPVTLDPHSAMRGA